MDEPILKSGQWPNVAIDPATGKHAATGEEIERGTKMTDNRTTLLPCPFCGGEALLLGDFAHGYIVECHDCSARTANYGSENAAKAIGAWNDRATHGTLTAEQVREAWTGNLKRDCLYDPPIPDWQAIADELNAELGSGINGDTSDGYHTFNELYHHRAVLFSVIVRDHREHAWKARKHHDGTMYDGMFIVGIETPKGQATYHYDLDPYWEMFDCEEREFAPEWDGHTPDEAIARIAELGSEPPCTVYIVESYDSLTEGGYVEPTCYTSKEAAIKRAESQTYEDGDGVYYWALWKELKVVEQ